MKKSTVLFGSGEEIMDQTRNPSLIKRRIKQNKVNAKKTNAKGKARITLPKNQTNKFGK